MLIMTYAGLRGAIGLSLALIIRHETAPDYMDTEKFKFF